MEHRFDYDAYQDLGVIMKSNKIRLHKQHIPLNSNLILNSQEEYDYHVETLLFLNPQIELGFNPKWLSHFTINIPAKGIDTEEKPIIH